MKLKKLIVCAMATLMVAASTLTAFAAELTAEEKDIIAALQDAGVPAEYVTQAENYLAKDDVVVTAEQATAIKSEIAAAKATANGALTLDALTDAQKEAISANVSAAAAELGLKVSYDSAASTIKVVDTATGSEVINVSANPIKDTGADMTMAIAVVTVLGAALAVCAVASKKVANN